MSLDQGQIWAAPVARTMTKGRTDNLPVISVKSTVIVYRWLKVKKPVQKWCMNVSDFSFNVEDMREWVNYCNARHSVNCTSRRDDEDQAEALQQLLAMQNRFQLIFNR